MQQLQTIETSNPSAQVRAADFKKNDIDHVKAIQDKIDSNPGQYKGKSKIAQRALLEEYKTLAVRLSELQKVVPTDDTTAAVYRIPKNKLPWVKFLWNHARANGSSINNVDRALLNNLWMRDDYKDNFLRAWDAIVKHDDATPRLPQPFPTKSEQTLMYDPKTKQLGGLTIDGDKITPFIANPGVYEPLTDSIIHFNNDDDLYKYIYKRNGGFADQKSKLKDPYNDLNNRADKLAALSSIIDNKFREISNLTRIKQRTSGLSNLKIDPKMQKLINYTRNLLMDSHITVAELEKIAEGFNYIRDMGQSKYILQLIDPFKHTSARVPSLLPVPSVNFTLRSRVNLSTNASGNAAFIYSPFALFNAMNTTSVLINNDATLSGTVASNFFTGVDMGQSLPIALYTKYRLVSAGMNLMFTTSQLNTSGFGVMGVSFTNIPSTIVGAVSPLAAPFGVFNTIENSYFVQNIASNRNESMITNYIPIDDSFLDYQDVGVVKQGFNIIGYVTGQPVNQIVARIDIVATYEALVDLQYTDYMPTNIYTGSVDDIRVINKMASSISQENKPLNPEHLRKSYEEHVDVKNEIPLGNPQILSDIDSTVRKKANEAKNAILKHELSNIEPSHHESFLSKLGKTAIDIAGSFLPMGNVLANAAKSFLFDDSEWPDPEVSSFDISNILN